MSCIWKIINIIDRNVGFLLRCVSPNPTVRSLILIGLFGDLVTRHLPYLDYILSRQQISDLRDIYICMIQLVGQKRVSFRFRGPGEHRGGRGWTDPARRACLELTVYSRCTLRTVLRMARRSVGIQAIGVQHFKCPGSPELAGACQPLQAHWEHLSRHRLAHAVSSAGPPILLTRSINHAPVRSSCGRDYAMCLPSFGGGVSRRLLRMLCIHFNAIPAFL